MKIYFTITGTQYRFGKEFLERGMEVKLVKEPDNEHDKEAIKVELEGLGTIGYVANSPRTVIGESQVPDISLIRSGMMPGGQSSM